MNSNLFKKIGLVLLAVLFLLQFVQPAKNIGSAKGPNDIAHAMLVPDGVQQILEKSCYDCHSNNTVYPWYSSIQPLGFWLKDHVDEGKSELNFSEFNTYTAKRKAKKMKEILEQLEENEMPLFSYTVIHRDADLNEAQKASLLEWAKANQLPSKLANDSSAVTNEAAATEYSGELHEEH